MGEIRRFQIAFLISLAVHAAVIFNGRVLPFIKPIETEKKTRVNYIKLQDIQKDLAPKERPVVRNIPPPFVDLNNRRKLDSAERIKEAQTYKPELVRTITPFKKKVNLPPIDIDKIDNPSYISYYQIVRERIRRAAYQNYSRNDTGEVYLAFVISNNGELRSTRLIEDKSSANTYLKNIALTSVKYASPFPVFPKELDYPELSFNVVISFEIE